MIVANLSSGRTIAADLSDPGARAELDSALRAGEVTAMSIRFNGSTVALPSPRRFKPSDTKWGYEALGTPDGVAAESVYLQAGAVRVSLTRASGSSLVRCDVTRTGRLMYNPSTR